MTQKNLLVYLLVSIHLFLAGCQQNTVRDIEGNRYRTIEIGDQVWMAENLRSTSYNDGTPIPNATGYDEWASLETAAYCWYNNDSSYRDPFGALYNWHVLESGELCPEGWHIPSDEEWNALVSSVDNSSRAGGALKESGTEHWRSPNIAASDQLGFAALPGGYRSYNGTFNLMRAAAYWWSATEANWYGSSSDGSRVIFRSVQHDNAELIRHISEKTNGFSVRCVKDI
jgi:uncharacterized protein (TIGR02145 family)